MEIKIIALRLRNFKGVRSAEYYFGGRNARIEGPNGCGKSTICDAFTWVLFGKDHRDQATATFELKTIDPATGRPYPREDHWVEVALSVDGTEHVLRRAWVEDWVKPTGKVDDVLKGHKSAFFVDGVDVNTKAAFDAVVGGWLREDSFKLITNPHYFIDDAFTGWKERRRALLDLVKDDPGRERVREEFADVVDKLAGRSIEEYRKRIAAERRANERDLAQVLSRIDGMREALPPEGGADAAAARLRDVRARHDKGVADVKAKMAAVDEAIASADAADAARKEQNAAIWAEITQVQLKMGQLITDATSAAQAQNASRSLAISAAHVALAEQQGLMRGAETSRETAHRKIEHLAAQRAAMASDLAKLGERYKAEKAKAFEYTPDTRCPYCGQQLPAATAAQARAEALRHFTEERKAEVERILAAARGRRDEIAALDERIAALEAEEEHAEAEYEARRKEAAAHEAELSRLQAQPEADLEAIKAAAREGDEYKALQARERELRSQALATSARPDGLDELVRQRKALEEQAAGMAAVLAAAEKEAADAIAVGKVRNDQLNLIKQKEQEAKNFADAIAGEEREEARAAAFVKADIDSVEEAINGLFKTARWKMFDTTMEGGIVEMCEVTSPDGVPYRSMNDAMKILCGMDCIRVFSQRFGSTAPIFIDNAEGILTTSFDTPAQVVRLVVKDTPELTLTTE